MIKIDDKRCCCGCTACQSICPRNSITMTPDDEGFLYPFVDKESCISCGLCEKVCPYNNNKGCMEPIITMAAKSTDENIQINSSSGGVFSEIASHILSRGGVVVGAAFDRNKLIVHQIIDDASNLYKLRGSKYVQSDLGDVFKEVEIILKNERVVLFSGTPCQINGLKNFLRRDYDNLLSVEIACHGVPSPKIWKDYLNSISNHETIKDIKFRDKRYGWSDYGLRIEYENGKEIYQNREKNIYLKGYLTNTFLRPSCYNCPSKNGKSGADIVLGDFWGIKQDVPRFYDKNGVSLVLAFTEKGYDVLRILRIKSITTPFKAAIKHNATIANNTPMPSDREVFWFEYNTQGLNAIRSAINRSRPNFAVRCMSEVKRKIRSIINQF